MTIEIGSKSPVSTDFEFEGKPLFTRRLPLRLGLKMQSLTEDGSLPVELIAEVISECVVFEDNSKVWSADEVLDFDTGPMLEVFSAISGSSLSGEEAEKN